MRSIPNAYKVSKEITMNLNAFLERTCELAHMGQEELEATCDDYFLDYFCLTTEEMRVDILNIEFPLDLRVPMHFGLAPEQELSF